MVRYLLKRFLLTLPALWLVLTLVFLNDSHRPGRSRRANAGRGGGPRAAPPNCVMHWDWIYRCARSMDTTCGTSATAILGNPSSFKRRCAKLSLNVTQRLFNLHSSHWLFRSEEHTSELQSRE